LKNIIYKRIVFDDGAQAFLIILLFSQLFFSNGLYLFFGALCFWGIFSKIQQPLKPSVFTIIFIYHFIQIAAGIWLSNYFGKDINYRSEHTDMATIFGFIGLVIMFLPILYFQNKIPNISIQNLRKHAERLSIKNSFKAYIIAFFVTNALGGLMFAFAGFSQIIVSIVNIKWFFFLLFGYQVILKKQMYKEFGFFVLLEFSLGFFSYFSDFKTVFFFIGFLAISFLVKVNLKQIIAATIVIVMLFYLGVKWTAIKGEYRGFLNKGSNTQTVGVGKEAAFNKLLELSGSNSDFDMAAASFFDRIQYTYHLAKTMDRVPALIPHENGANIGKILGFVLVPRFFNPNKPKLEASVKTSKYTGIGYLGASSGVSFSLGYFADCYIDFGYYGMMIPLLILGFIFGSTYFYFIKHSSNNFIFNYAVAGAIFMEFTAFEADGTYLMGRLFATLVTFFMLKLFLFPGLYNYLSAAATLTENEERAADKQEKMERLQAKSSSP